MFQLLTLPYVFRRRCYELQSPTSIYQLRFISPQISRESFFIPLSADKLYLNAFDSFTYIDESGLLCQKIGYLELLRIKRCIVTKELFIDQLSTQQLSAISYCIDGIYSSLSLTGFPYFEDFKRLLKPAVKSLTFCGKIIDLPGLKELFESFENLTSLILVQYCEATNLAAVEMIINNFVMKNKENLKYFRYTLTCCNPDNSSFTHLYATFEQNVMKICTFGDNL